MKYKLAGLSALLLAIVTAVTAFALLPEKDVQRYHQHKDAQQPEQGCDCGGAELCTHLPLVLISTDGREIPGKPIVDETGVEIDFTRTEADEDMLSAHICVIENETANNHPSDTPTLESDMLIRIRGNTSRYFEKPSYLVRLTKPDGSYRHETVMGMEPHYEWALHGPYLDKSLIRNYMWYNIAGEIMDYAPNVRFCEVMIDGQYRGLYVMTETITSSPESRLKLQEPIEGLHKTGYVVRLDRGSDVQVKNIDTFTQYTYRNLQEVDIKYPRSGSLTQDMADAIAQDVSDFEKALYSYDYNTNDYGYWHNIDTGSFVDYFILNEFTANYDAGWLSTYLYKDIGGKCKLCIWDFNSACDNYIDSTVTPQHTELQDNIWYFMLMKDDRFNKRILRRYAELRKGILSEAYLNRYIDDTVSYLGGAVERNFAVWGDSLSKNMLRPDERNVYTHAQALTQIRMFIAQRGAWLDAHFETILQYSHKSKNKKFNH